jgi:beta-glucosidase
MRLGRLSLLAGVVTLVAGTGVGSSSAAAACGPWMNAQQTPAQRTSELLGAMSLGDKIQMVTGEGEFNPTTANPAAAGNIAANPALCIPALVLNDATSGVGDQQQLTTAFPDSIVLASAWDPPLAQQYGAALGREAFAKGVNVMLGPGVDIARNPLNGRNFEYAGEDPYLAGQAGAGIIHGIQSQHVIATVKHYALNDQETARTTDSSDASERTIQEIDLPAFQAAVKAGVGSVMCSYNRINSVYACENPTMLHGVLDGQFGFSGFVMSDWGANHSTVASANAGMDMEMPGGVSNNPEYYGPALQTAVQSGQVSMATLNDMVRRIVYTMFRLGLFDHVPAEGAGAAATPATNSDSIAMARKVAEEGTVLLKNGSGVLPLSGPGKRIAVIGPAANSAGATLAEQGYGSGHVPEFAYQPGVVSPLQSITSRAAQAGDVVTYADGDATDDAVAAASAADLAVVFVNDAEIEGADRPDLDVHSGTCSFADVLSPTSCSYSPLDQNALVSAVAAANPHTIVVIQSGGPVAMPWAGQVQGILENWFPGQVDGDAIAPVLFGDVDPSGKLPVTFPVKLSDDPLQTAAQYPGVTVPGDSVGPHSSYSEGLLVGYRWYDARNIAPLFPFGYGLSYTTFRYSGIAVKRTGAGASVTFTVTNTGRRAGAAVGQVYVGAPASVGEPPKQLEGFRRVELHPGQSAAVTIPLGAMSFAHWDTTKHAWAVSGGTYQVMVGSSSRDIFGQGSVALPAETP